MRISLLRKVFIVDDESTIDGLAVHPMSIVPFSNRTPDAVMSRNSNDAIGECASPLILYNADSASEEC
jgi:hypothetical protein